jgi:predicted CXXCH cytochrome family protein
MGNAKPSLVSLVLIACTVVSLPSRLGAQTQAPQYVGSEACLACHEDVAAKIADSAHGKLAQENTPERRGCEACHGPGSNHVNSGGDKSLLFSFHDASGVAIRRRCSACHESESDQLHSHRTATCLSCHSAHHYREKEALLVETTPLLCTNCHDRGTEPRR